MSASTASLQLLFWLGHLSRSDAVELWSADFGEQHLVGPRKQCSLCVCVCVCASQTVHLCSGAPKPKARVSQTLTGSGAAVTTDTSSAGLRAHRLKGLLDAFGQGESAYVGKKFSTMFKEYTFALITLNTAMLWAAADLNDGFKVGSSFGSESAGVYNAGCSHLCRDATQIVSQQICSETKHHCLRSSQKDSNILRKLCLHLWSSWLWPQPPQTVGLAELVGVLYLFSSCQLLSTRLLTAALILIQAVC